LKAAEKLQEISASCLIFFWLEKTI
jgi:hypothetical protein